MSLHLDRCLEYKCNADATQIEVTIAGEKYIIDKQYNKVLVEPKEITNSFIDGPQDWNGFCNTYPLPCQNSCSSGGYCMGKTCHCHTDRAGVDCSIECRGNKVLYKGTCLASDQCPKGTILHEPTKECQGEAIEDTVLCTQGTYLDDNKKCQQCPKNCSGCTNLNTCTDCKEGYKVEQLLDGIIACKKVGEIECEENQYIDKELNECKPCLSSCSSCQNATTCETCAQAHYKETYSQTCRKCNTGCAKCSYFNMCEICQEGYKILHFYQYQYCFTSCPAGFSEINGECQRKL